MDQDLQERAARTLGMKPSEIAAVDERADDVIVTTHDGQQVRVWFGAVGPCVEPYTAPAAPATETASTAADEGDDAKEPEVVTPAGADPEEVPDGTAADVLAWVNEQPESAPERARRALEAENGKEKPRSGLVAQLEKLAQP
ncbi:hypothetical protein [Amycolatopsis thermoflava]|uniref:hypothetical protein n=1 Tax=Amycolatopsis thermoflava TaxID=84480 RepID=UPI0037F44DB8